MFMKEKLTNFVATLMLLTAAVMNPIEVSADYNTSGDPDFLDNYLFPEGVDEDIQVAWSHIPFKRFNHHFFSNFILAISDEGWDCDDRQQGTNISNYYNGTKSMDYLLNEWDYRFQGKWDGRYWYRYWDMIAVVNGLLEKIPSKELTAQEKDRYMAEIRVLRAFYYLQLVKHYGRLPIVIDTQGIYSSTADLSLRAAYEVCDFIVNDCKEALKSENLPWHLDQEADLNRMTKAIACAIMSQASLFGASPLYCDGLNLWNRAYEINKEAFDLLTANGYELYTQLNNPYSSSSASGYRCSYQEYFAMTSVPGTHPEDKETIWGAKNFGVGLVQINQMPVFSDGHYKCGFVPTQEIVDAYDMLATGEPIYDLANPYIDEKHSDININPASGYKPEYPYDGRDPRFYGSIFYNMSRVNTGVIAKYVQTFNRRTDWMGNKPTDVSDNNVGNCAIDLSSRMNTRTGYYLRKYHGDKANAMNNLEEGNWKYFRLGEVYLNYAEAAIEAGHIQEGLNLINAIRHRAGFAPAVDKKTSDQATARLYVRHERQVELAFEEHRFFDVRRWKTLGEEISEEKYKTGMWCFEAYSSYNRFNLHVPAPSQSPAMKAQTDNDEYVQSSSDPKWTLLPIPIPEVERLVKLTGKPAEYWQNPLHYQEEDYSGVETVTDNAFETVRIYVSGSNVTVVTSGEYRIVDLLGCSVAKGCGVSNVVLRPGMYIATANGKSVKFAVK